MATTDNPHAEIRKRIMRRLNTDEWMEKHFGIACHAGDVADAVLDLFETVDVEAVIEVIGHGPVPTGKTRLVLRTAPEAKP